jgi:probable addiction module antidote protein
MNTRAWRDVAVERMKKDPKAAAAYLKIALEEYEKDSDTASLLVALRTVVEARGGIGALSKSTGLNRQTLYRTLAGQHSPRLDTLTVILNFCGLALSLKPSKTHGLTPAGVAA